MLSKHFKIHFCSNKIPTITFFIAEFLALSIIFIGNINHSQFLYQKCCGDNSTVNLANFECSEGNKIKLRCGSFYLQSIENPDYSFYVPKINGSYWLKKETFNALIPEKRLN